MIFLLGGYDLEMITIKKLLEDNGITYIDKNLSWGAKLSDYKDEFSTNKQIYGIELEEDITPPKNYSSIDHHNQNSHMPSSLEQVAKILNIKLSRDQQLVSANDSGYIKGMQNICATQDEIENIRRRDREAQGVTQKDENLATKSIVNSNTHIIYSLTPHFSAISDKVYTKYDHFIIYNDTKIVFYNYEVKKTLDFLSKNSIKPQDYYNGGGEFGFVGIKEDVLDNKEIKSLLKEFKKMLEQKKIISHHIFMFPFIIIDGKDEDEDERNKNRAKLTQDWEFQAYRDNYNERAYFHSFFQKSMFTDKKEDENSYFYTKKEYKNSEFIICKSKEYKLNLKSINLRIFTTGVGILSFHLENTKHTDIEDILEINDYGRRIYPEYLDEKQECTLVPNYIKIKKNQETVVEENFRYKERPTEIKLSKIITKFLPEANIRPAIDDRMVVISFYKNSNFSNDLKRDYIKNDKWYEYVYIDGAGKTVQNNDMQYELIKKATYSRWQGYGTLFGISKYSFVAMAEDSDFIEKTVENHMKTMYFQMFSLLLMLRATILKFSAEVSDIADDIDKPETAEKVSKLYKRYIQFVNRFYFREITAKDQGLEIYEKAMSILNIQRDIKDLDAEIEELHKFVEIQTEKETADKMNTLTWIGGVLLPPSIVTGFLGMNTLSGLSKYAWFDKSDYGLWSIGTVLISATIVPIYLKYFKKGDL